MGREIRLVQPGWEHPRDDRGEYVPECDREYRGEDAMFQVYENITEGTPVTPAFTTREELEDYLVEHGDDFDRMGGFPPPSREAARIFIQDGYAPTGGISRLGTFRTYETLP